MAERHPRDARNKAAAELLHELATQPADVSLLILTGLETYTTSTLCTVAEELARRVGFRVFVSSLAEFLTLVADAADERTSANREAIAKVFGGGR
jgi:hypothetical protein